VIEHGLCQPVGGLEEVDSFCLRLVHNTAIASYRLSFYINIILQHWPVWF